MMNEGCPHDLPYPVNPNRLRGRLLIFEEGKEVIEIAYNNVRTNEDAIPENPHDMGKRLGKILTQARQTYKEKQQ